MSKDRSAHCNLAVHAIMILWAGVWGILSFAGSPAMACGPTTKCMLGERHYLIRMPKGHDGKTRIGAIVYAHGYRGTAKQVMVQQVVRAASQSHGRRFHCTEVVRRGLVAARLPVPCAWRKAGRRVGVFRSPAREDVARRFPIDAKKDHGDGIFRRRHDGLASRLPSQPEVRRVSHPSPEHSGGPFRTRARRHRRVSFTCMVTMTRPCH